MAVATAGPDIEDVLAVGKSGAESLNESQRIYDIVLQSAPDLASAVLISSFMKSLDGDSLARAPALAAAELYQAIARTMATAARNATANQQQDNITTQAAAVMGVTTLYSIDTATTGEAATKIAIPGRK